MPVLHYQFQSKAKAPDGSDIDLPPPQVLQQRGPCVQVSVGLALPVAQQLQQQGQTVPAPVSGWALLDTGASVTCIDDAAAGQLQLPVIDVTKIASASHAATESNVYPIHLEFIGTAIEFSVPRAYGATLTAHGLLLLVGRDVLRHGTLHYNGLSGEITFAV